MGQFYIKSIEEKITWKIQTVTQIKV